MSQPIHLEQPRLTTATPPAKDRAARKRADRAVVAKRKHRPREKPAAAKEAISAGRAAKPKVAKRRAPAKVKETPRSALTSLPFEILDLIIGYILPSSHFLADHLPHPSETPYPPASLNVTSSLKARPERWGVVPQTVVDIIQFGRCCRQTREAVERAVGGLGGSYPRAQVADADQSPTSASTKASTSSSASIDGEEEVRTDGRRQLYLRVEHCDRLVAIMSRSRETLEHVVFYHCGGEHGTTHDSGQRDCTNASPINRTPPLQFAQSTGYVPLPRLRSLQIGPDVCGECSQACLHLLTGRTYYSRTSEDAGRGWVLTRLYGGYGGWAGETFDTVAAPALEAIQLYLPLSSSKIRSHYGSSYASAYERVIDTELRNKIKTFSLILPNMDRKWGGFGVAGFTSSVHQRSKEVIEKELAERAKVYLTTSAVTKRQKGKPVIGKLQEKWALQAKAAMVKKVLPASSVGQAETNAVAAALVSSIKPKIDPSRDVDKADKVKDREPKVGEEKSAVGQTTEDKSGVSKVGNGLKEAQTAEERDMGVTAEKDNGDSIKVPGEGAADMVESTSTASEDISTPSAEANPPAEATAVGPSATGAGQRSHRIRVPGEDPSVTEYDKQALANRIRLHNNYPILLKDIADTFPNLVSLQVLRQGATRNDVVEGLLPLEEYVAVYVTPLRRLHKLQYLDLGLAIVGRREVSDFPLAMTTFEREPGMNPIEIRELEVRRQLYKADITRAIKEGDAWRVKVLERFVLGRRDGVVDGEASDDEDGYPHTIANTSSDIAAPKLPKGWPMGVRTGFIYSMDLEQRARTRGVLCTWSRGMKEGSGKDKTPTEGVMIAKTHIVL